MFPAATCKSATSSSSELIKQRLWNRQLCRNCARSQIHIRHGKRLYLRKLQKLLHRRLCLRNLRELSRLFAHRVIERGFDRAIVVRQRPHPAGRKKRSSVAGNSYKVREDALNLLFVHCKRIDRPRADAVLLRQPARLIFCLCALGVLWSSPESQTAFRLPACRKLRGFAPVHSHPPEYP